MHPVDFLLLASWLFIFVVYGLITTTIFLRESYTFDSTSGKNDKLGQNTF